MNLARAYLVVDVETGGFDASRCALLSIGAVLVVAGELVTRFYRQVLPAPGLEVEPEAAAVNGYDPATWSGISEAAALGDFVAYLRASSAEVEELVLAGQHLAFDVRFLAVAGDRNPERAPGLRARLEDLERRSIDTRQLAVVPWLAGAIPGRSLSQLTQALLGRPSRHHALHDAEDTAEVLVELGRRIAWQP